MTKPKRNIMRKFRINEIAGVDRGAQGGKNVVILKRGPAANSVEKHFEELVNPRLLTDTDGHTHLLELSGAGGETFWSKSENEEYGHTHPWVQNTDGTVSIGMAEGHTHEVRTVEKAAGSSGGGNQGADSMADTNPAAVEKKLEEAVNKVSDLEKKLAKAEAFGQLNDTQRAYYAKLSDAEQSAFLAKNNTERDTVIQKAAESDPVVYTSADGTEFRKSDGRTADMAKRLDEQAAQLRKSQEAVENATFEKAAGEKMNNLPGDTATKIGLLKAVSGIPDEAVRAKVSEIIAAANTAMSGAFDRDGTSEGQNTEESGAEDEIQKIADGILKDSPSMNPAEAYVKALETPAGRKAYAKIGV